MLSNSARSRTNSSTIPSPLMDSSTSGAASGAPTISVASPPSTSVTAGLRPTHCCTSSSRSVLIGIETHAEITPPQRNATA